MFMTPLILNLFFPSTRLFVYLVYINKKSIPLTMHPLFKHKENALTEFRASNYDIALEHYTSAINSGEALLKSNIDFYDLDSGSADIDVNYEIALLKYNVSLIHARKHEYSDAIDSCVDAFTWLEKIKDKTKRADDINRIVNYIENRYYISMLKTGYYALVLKESKDKYLTKELSDMLKRLRCIEFETFFDEVAAVKKNECDLSGELLKANTAVDYKNEDIIVTQQLFLNVLLWFVKGQNIPENLLISILKVGYKSMVNNDNVVFVKSNKAYIFGDTHGQFLDTLCLLTSIPGNTFDDENGLLLDKEAVFIFNGDFVDRGPQGIENFIMLIMLKILNPTHIYLNRGNHEFESINVQFGFLMEVYQKYNSTFRTIFTAFETTFTSLPLCTVLNNEIFIVHGGLPYHTSLTEIQLRNRFIKDINDEVISGLMWSDPGEIENWKQNMRGAGIVFGLNITNTFLFENNLKMIVRSHEFVDGGYRENHDRKVKTIFSAPNYCGARNKASYIKVFNGQFEVVQFGEWSEYERFKMFVEKVRNIRG